MFVVSPRWIGVIAATVALHVASRICMRNSDIAEIRSHNHSRAVTHRGTRRGSLSDGWPHSGVFPNTRNAYVDSYQVRYVPPHGKKTAYALVSMHLDSYDEVSDGSGTFGGRTPLGPVRVTWQRRWRTLSKDEQGLSTDSEHSSFLFYTLTIDSPARLPVHLETQQYELYSARINGRFIPLIAHGSGERDLHGPVDARHYSYTFPGGHNVIVLRLGTFWSE